MAAETPALVISLEAAADLSAAQYRFVEVTGANTCNQINASTDAAAGVLQNKPGAAGRAATVMSDGVSKVVAGAAVTAGAMVMSDTQGRAVTAATTGNMIQGIALSSCSNAGEIITVLVKPLGKF